MNVKIIEPISYCIGVKKAIDKVFDITKNNPNKKIYLLGKVVNNNEVIKQLNEIGVNTINVTPDQYHSALSIVENDSIVIFSAHGHDLFLENYLKERKITFYSTTCNIIEKTIIAVKESLNTNHKIIFIGIENHPETVTFSSLDQNVFVFNINTMSFLKKIDNYNDIFDVYCQSTLSQNILNNALNNIKNTFRNVNNYANICPTTKARTALLFNNNVVAANAIIVIGSKTSSNCTRLYENAKSLYPDKTIIFVENLNELKSLTILSNVQDCVLLSGTSTPLNSILEIYNYLKSLS